MNIEEICDKDCEKKDFFKHTSQIEYVVVCLSCIHSKRINNYVPRKNVNEMTILQRIKNNVANYFIRNSRF